ncbi:type II toxin-antitoxin system RelE family toxin [Peptoniphilus sp. SGI.035]|uniref:type II toxin-antitoxin system RelE family toxin n=1 Tax=Peptoniphilus sp. SGI.035 TaxID=3420564 RepID=UPI003CFE8BE7
MNYKLSFINEAIEDYKSLDGSQRKVVDKALKRILLNPLPNTQGGYGKPLSNLSNSKLAGLMKIKLKSSGLRIVYKLEQLDNEVLIIIIGARSESKVYKDAEKRVAKLED